MYDAPTTSTFSCLRFVEEIEVAYVEPDAGVTSTTGLLLCLPGIDANGDCVRNHFVYNPAWPDSHNLVAANIFIRNITFFPPYDFGKYQMVDTLRGVGELLERFPQIDRRRLYVIGGSGGGHLTLQLLQATPHLWSEVYVQSAITKITTADDTVGLYENDGFAGWNVNLSFPTVQGALPDAVWNRYRAERALRSPQNHAERDAKVYPRTLETVPHVWMAHGTNDATVDFQHLLDYEAAIAAGSGISATTITPVVRELGNWRFIDIVNGGHNFAGAAADENSRAEVVEKYNPAAFTRLRSTPPVLSIDYTYPARFGWTYRLHGTSLRTVEIETIQLPAAATTLWHCLE